MSTRYNVSISMEVEAESPTEAALLFQHIFQDQEHPGWTVRVEWNGVPPQTEMVDCQVAAMKPYMVVYLSNSHTGFQMFSCMADDAAHAREQAENAYPGALIQRVIQTDNSVTAWKKFWQK